MRIDLGEAGPRCRVGGIAHRRPVVRRVGLATATALVAAGVPSIVRRTPSESRLAPEVPGTLTVAGSA